MEPDVSQQSPKRMNWSYILLAWSLGLAFGIGGATARLLPLYRASMKTATEISQALDSAHKELDHANKTLSEVRAKASQAAVDSETKASAERQGFIDSIRDMQQRSGISYRNGLAETTMLYEFPPPGYVAKVGYPGTQTGAVPRWIIPAKVTPLAVCPAQGEVYYYVNQDNRFDGPYVPNTGGQPCP